MADKPQDNKPTGPISVRSYVLGRDGKLRGGEAAHDPEDEWKKAEAGWEVAKQRAGAIPPTSAVMENMRRSIEAEPASRIEQGERSSESTTVSEGGALPKTWKEAIPYVVWVVLILGFGLEAVAALVRGDWLHLLVSAVGLVGLMAMALHWKRLQSWAAGINPNWIVAAFALLLQAAIFTPFVEQQRLPFTVNLGNSPSPTGRVWPSLTKDEKSLLSLALNILPKRSHIRIICLTSDCRELAQDFMEVTHNVGWAPWFSSSNAFFYEPYGITLYLKDVNDHSLSDAIEKTTKLKIDHIEPTIDPNLESIFIGIRP